MVPIIEIKDGCCICSPTGSLTLDEVDGMKTGLRKALDDKSVKNVIIDCDDLRMIDSSGLGLVTSVFLTCRKSKIGFGLCSLNVQVRESLQIVHLESVLPIYKSLDAAVEALKAA